MNTRPCHAMPMSQYSTTLPYMCMPTYAAVEAISGKVLTAGMRANPLSVWYQSLSRTIRQIPSPTPNQYSTNSPSKKTPRPKLLPLHRGSVACIGMDMDGTTALPTHTHTHTLPLSYILYLARRAATQNVESRKRWRGKGTLALHGMHVSSHTGLRLLHHHHHHHHHPSDR